MLHKEGVYKAFYGSAILKAGLFPFEGIIFKTPFKKPPWEIPIFIKQSHFRILNSLATQQQQYTFLIWRRAIYKREKEVDMACNMSFRHMPSREKQRGFSSYAK